MCEKTYEKYGGKLDVQAMVARWEEFRAYVSELRKTMEPLTFPLHAYLYSVQMALMEVSNALETGSDGFEFGMAELNGMLRFLRDQDGEKPEPSDFFDKVIAYGKDHDLNKPGVRHEAFIELFSEYVRHTCAEYLESCNQALDEAMAHQGVLRKRARLVDLIGEDRVAHLDSLLYRHWVMLSPVRMYAQGLLENLSYALMSVYDDTGKIPM